MVVHSLDHMKLLIPIRPANSVLRFFQYLFGYTEYHSYCWRSQECAERKKGTEVRSEGSNLGHHFQISFRKSAKQSLMASLEWVDWAILL